MILSAEERPVVKAGAILSLSAGLEQWCGYIRQGIELAVSEEGPIKVEVAFEDDRSTDRKAALMGTQKLLQVNKIETLFSWTTSTLSVIDPAVTQAKTPLVVGAYDVNVKRAGPYVYGGFVNYDLVSKQIANFLIMNKKARRLAIVMAEDAWSQNFETAFREEAQRRGAEVVMIDKVAPHENDMRSIVVKLKKENVEGVLAPLYSSSLYSFLKEVRDLHFGGIINVADGMFEEDIKTAGTNAEGVYATQIWLESPKLANAYKQKFGDTTNPLQLGLVALGYDWVKHMQGIGVKIINDGKKISRETIAAALKSYTSLGYLGEQRYGVAPEYSGEVTVVVRDGRFQVIK